MSDYLTNTGIIFTLLLVFPQQLWETSDRKAAKHVAAFISKYCTTTKTICRTEGNCKTFIDPILMKRFDIVALR